MKFLKIETRHTMEQLDLISNSMLSSDSDILLNIFDEYDYINFRNDIGNICTYIIIDSNIEKLLEIYNSYNIEFTICDISKDVLFSLVKSDGFVYDSFINKFINSYINTNIDADIVLDKINELGIKSLNEIDNSVLKNI